VAAAGALVCVACFTLLGLMGGLDRAVRGMPWHGAWRGDWRDAGPQTSRDLPFAGGQRLDIAYPAEITVTQGPQPRFTVTGPKGLIDRLRLEDGVLKSDDEPGFLFGRHRHGRLRIDIVTPDTREFHLAGAEKLTIRGYDQDSLTLHASGAADVQAQGKARRLEVHVSGAGHFDLGELPVDDAEVAISGAGDATLDPHVSADISISGAGHVKLKTKPANLQTHISGFGSVEQP
jgi:hypothetical protein